MNVVDASKSRRSCPLPTRASAAKFMQQTQTQHTACQPASIIPRPCPPGPSQHPLAGPAAHLQQHGDEGLDLQDLGALLHQQVVILEAQLQKLPGWEKRGGGRREGAGRHVSTRNAGQVRTALHPATNRGPRPRELLSLALQGRVRARHGHDLGLRRVCDVGRRSVQRSVIRQAVMRASPMLAPLACVQTVSSKSAAAASLHNRPPAWS